MKTQTFVAFAAGLEISACAFAMPTLQEHNLTVADMFANNGTYTTKSFAPLSEEIYFDGVAIAKVDPVTSYGGTQSGMNMPGSIGSQQAFPAAIIGGSTDSFGGKMMGVASGGALNFDSYDAGEVSLPRIHIVPAPGALLLVAIGTGVVGWLRKRRAV